jgi:hypothetical protein
MFIVFLEIQSACSGWQAERKCLRFFNYFDPGLDVPLITSTRQSTCHVL